MANLQLVYKEICQMSFQAITNFLLNQNNVDLKNNFLDLQTTDFNNSKIREDRRTHRLFLLQSEGVCR